MNYISIAEATEKWGITPRGVQALCAQDRIPGLSKLGKPEPSRRMPKSRLM